MTEVVVDASLAAQWVLIEPYSAESKAILRDWDVQGVQRVVPTWFACELSNVLYKRILRGQMTLTRARYALDVVLAQVVLSEVDPVALARRGLELADEFGRPAAYDSHYLALAEQLGCELWTADERFWNATRSKITWIRWVGEVAASP